MARQIMLFTSVNPASAESIVMQLLAFDRESSDEITMFINSPGGSVLSLFTIIDTMRAVRSPIRTIVIGMAASAAAIIAASGNKRLITENSEIMIHEVFNLVIGTTSQIEEDVKRTKEMENRLLGILSKATGKSLEQLQAITKKTDKYFNAKQALSFGLVDQIIKPNEAQILKLSEGINGESFEISSDLKEVQLLRTGKFVHPTYGEIEITGDILNKIKENFDNRVRDIDISIDYTHDNEAGDHPAACWLKSLETRDTVDGQALFAHSEFTPNGEKQVREKEYKYASADFVINYITEQGTSIPYVLRGGTLTNRPFIKGMNAIKLSEHKQTANKEIIQMDKNSLIASLKEHGVDVEATNVSLQSALSEVETLKNKINELNALPIEKDTEIAALKAKLAETSQSIVAAQKETAFNDLIVSGKVAPAQKESILATFDSAEKITAFYKDAPAVVNFKAVGHDDVDVDGLTDVQAKAVASGEVSKEDVLKYGK